ncbi:MAG: hypothetical protein R3B72_11700 [Polyangiaceae bacterium]
MKRAHVLSVLVSLAALACQASPSSPADVGGGGTSSAAGGSTSAGGTTSAPPDAYFPASWIYEPIANAPVHPESATMTQWLQNNGSWGSGQMRIDFSLQVLVANEDTPMRSFEPTDEFYEPDCDHVEVPLPAGGALEEEEGYACLGDGDCHLIVRDPIRHRLFELWRANVTDAGFFGGCLAAWDMTRVYDEVGRGEHCTSADAAGFPIAPLIFTADEVASGEIRHAIRFILPNPRMRAGVYARPATHGASPSGPEAAPIFGGRWRLRADYDLSTLPSEGARVVARAMQTYGMALADGGDIAITGQSDRFTAAKWEGLLDSYDLSALQPTDFEVVDTGAAIPITWDCQRTPY